MPTGASFSIQRTFQYTTEFNAQLRQVGSLQEVLESRSGEHFYFDGKRLFIKLTDPGVRGWLARCSAPCFSPSS
jgi:hypothetical protein